MSLEILKQIGRNLASLRKARAILQTEAARLSGISYRYYQRIEGGRANMTLSTLFKLAKFYHVNPRDLFPS